MLRDTRRATVGAALSTLLLLGSSALAADHKVKSDASPDHITKEVRHELVMLPYYGVFDNLAYRVDGGTVTLFGEVTRPTLKSDAENSVKRIEGVTRVIRGVRIESAKRGLESVLSREVR